MEEIRTNIPSKEALLLLLLFPLPLSCAPFWEALGAGGVLGRWSWLELEQVPTVWVFRSSSISSSQRCRLGRKCHKVWVHLRSEHPNTHGLHLSHLTHIHHLLLAHPYLPSGFLRLQTLRPWCLAMHSSHGDQTGGQATSHQNTPK